MSASFITWTYNAFLKMVSNSSFMGGYKTGITRYVVYIVLAYMRICTFCGDQIKSFIAKAARIPEMSVGFSHLIVSQSADSE